MQRHVAGRAVVISSPSGGGKTTLIRRLQRRFPSMTRSVSVTTRRPRRGERQGREYLFVSPARFRQLRRAGELLEWARVHDAYYGTPQPPVLEALAQRRGILLSLDVQGARSVRRALGKNAVLIFLLPPSLDQLERRLVRRRTETRAAIRRRLSAAKRELACAAWYDYAVVNDRLNDAVEHLAAIIHRHMRG